MYDLNIVRLIKEGAAQMEPVSCKHSNTQTITDSRGYATTICSNCGEFLLSQSPEEIEITTLREENNALRLRIAQLEQTLRELRGEHIEVDE